MTVFIALRPPVCFRFQFITTAGIEQSKAKIVDVLAKIMGFLLFLSMP